MKIKICGLTNSNDAQLACRLGADYLGVILTEKSKRYVAPEQLPTLFDDVPKTARRVGVFVNASLDFIKKSIELGELDIVQCHGDESVEYLESIKDVEVWAARSVATEEQLKKVVDLPVSMLLLDAPKGDSSTTCNWALAEKLASLRPIMLAGGLSVENLALAMATVKPYGVDVASGVELNPREKSVEKLTNFIKIAKGY